jgi:phosphoglycolate phosphatase
MPGQVSKLLLFDLDGTLMLSGGAGKRAMERAMKDRFGIDGAFRDIKPDGMTDPMIFREIFHNFGLEIDDLDETIGQLAEEYRVYMLDEMPRSKEALLMPGVVEVLTELSKYDHVQLALLTGNFEATARIKLDRFDLNRFFPFGAFASDDPVRSNLPPIAIARAEKHAGHKIGMGRHVFIIGDTDRDVRAALDNGATAVGVATARYTQEDLRKAGAHLTFEDFRDINAVCEKLEINS